MAMEISRRSFLKGAAATGVVAALSSIGISAAAEEAAAADESVRSYLPQEKYDIAEERDFDVVVVGAGGGGMSAAIRAAQLGMNELISNLIRSGIRPDQFHFVDQPDVALALSVAGMGLTSLPISFRQDGIPLRYVEYDTPVCRMSYSLAWRSDTENPAVRLFCGEVSRTDWPYAGS